MGVVGLTVLACNQKSPKLDGSTISTIINGLNSPEASPGGEKTDDTGLDNRLFSFVENDDTFIVGLPRGLFRSYSEYVTLFDCAYSLGRLCDFLTSSSGLFFSEGRDGRGHVLFVPPFSNFKGDP